jgi:predicted PhzF superfamily epimerase YddE/YHI9
VTELHVLRVFLGPDGRGGNPLGIVLDGAAVPPMDRQATAARIGFSETVFVDRVDVAPDESVATIRIFTPGVELAFAGHPTVGTSWFLGQPGRGPVRLRCPAGDVATWADDDGRRWIRAQAAWVHPIAIEQLPTVADVDALAPGPLGSRGRYAWAWIDEAAGTLRSRYFPTDLGILEDEATGAAAVVMGDRLGRPLTIRQGVASELQVRPDLSAGTVDVGGFVVSAGRQEVP